MVTSRVKKNGDETVGHPYRGLADGGVVALQPVGQVLDPLADLVGRARLGQVVAHHGQGLDLAHHLVEVAAELAALADGGRHQEGHRRHRHQDQARHHRGHGPRPAQVQPPLGGGDQGREGQGEERPDGEDGDRPGRGPDEVGDGEEADEGAQHPRHRPPVEVDLPHRGLGLPPDAASRGSAGPGPGCRWPPRPCRCRRRPTYRRWARLRPHRRREPAAPEPKGGRGPPPSVLYRRGGAQGAAVDQSPVGGAGRRHAGGDPRRAGHAGRLPPGHRVDPGGGHLRRPAPSDRVLAPTPHAPGLGGAGGDGDAGRHRRAW